MERREGNGVRHKREIFLNRHQASPGGGEELYLRPSHLLSRRTEREKEGARGAGGEGWGRMGEMEREQRFST